MIIGRPLRRSTLRSANVMIRRVGVAVLLVLAACGDDDGGGVGDSDLLPAHREMIDNLAADGDCASLQARFDDAADAGGERNTALMKYADEAMDRIGCYD